MFEMNKEESMNIDDKVDFNLVECIVKNIV